MAETDAKGWPLLKSAQETDCDGTNPMTGRLCIRGRHAGYHGDDVRAEWKEEIHDPRD